MAEILFSTALLLLAVVVVGNKAQLAMLAGLAVVVVDTLAEIIGLEAQEHLVKVMLAGRLVGVLHITVEVAVEVLAPLVARLLALLAVLEAQARHLL
jgi:hypothetical protein